MPSALLPVQSTEPDATCVAHEDVNKEQPFALNILFHLNLLSAYIACINQHPRENISDAVSDEQNVCEHAEAAGCIEDSAPWGKNTQKLVHKTVTDNSSTQTFHSQEHCLQTKNTHKSLDHDLTLHSTNRRWNGLAVATTQNSISTAL